MATDDQPEAEKIVIQHDEADRFIFSLRKKTFSMRSFGMRGYVLIESD